MRVFSSEPLYSLRNRLKKSLFAEKQEDLDYQEGWFMDEDEVLSHEPVDNQEPQR